jgi:hypothetical protein
MAMLWGVFLISFIIYGDMYMGTPPRLAPCPNPDWHLVASFLVVLSLAVALVESLNWVGWFITRDSALPTELKQPGGDLLVPNGWTGPALAIGLLAVAYVLRRPNLCEPLQFGTMSLREFVGTLSLAYGLLILTQSYHGLNLKSSSPKPE